jgi:hypothetical protein
MATVKSSNRVNGINLNVLSETVRAIQGDPELGKCHFRARNTWIDANHNCTTVSGFYGGELCHHESGRSCFGKGHSHRGNIRMTYKVKTDEPNLAKLKKLAEFSPVYNTLMHGTQVDIQVEAK